ncbi:MAG: hypothetical protein V1899_00530 [Planctomycetota bacterium]
MSKTTEKWDNPIQAKTSGLDVLLEIACIATERVLTIQRPDGIFRVPDRLVNETFHHYNQQVIYNLARLYKLEHPLNSLCGRKDVLGAAIRNGDALAGHYRRCARKKAHADHRALYCWLMATEALGVAIGFKRKKQWEAVIYASSVSLAEEIGHVRSRLDAPLLCPNVQLGRGFNHITMITALVYIIGKYFRDDAYMKMASDMMRKLAICQQSDGYWTEYDGPSPFLNYITLEGVRRYYAASGDRTMLRFIRKAVEFNVRCLSPDMAIIANLDDRVQFDRCPTGPEALAWGLAPFAHIPVWGLAAAQYSTIGRSYLAEALERLPQRLSKERLCSYLELYVLLLQAYDAIPRNLRLPVKTSRSRVLPFLKTSSRTILERNALIEKRGPWMFSVSGIVAPAIDRSKFKIERQSFLSLFHKDAGHIIVGTNSKNQPNVATFRGRFRGGRNVFLPRRSELDVKKRKLDLFFDGFIASLEIASLSRDTAKILMRLLPTGDGAIEVNLVVGAFFDDRVIFRQDKKETCETLGRTGIEYGWQNGKGSIACNHWELTVPESAVFRWPFIPFCSYTPNLRSPIRRSWSVLSIPFGERTEMEIKATIH